MKRKPAQRARRRAPAAGSALGPGRGRWGAAPGVLVPRTGALSAAEANLGLEGPEHRRGCWIEAAQGLTGGGRGGAPLRAVTRRRLGLARRIGVDGGVRLGRLKGPGGDRGGAQRDKDPGVLAGDLGALLRGGEEGKGEREPLTGGAVLAATRGGRGRNTGAGGWWLTCGAGWSAAGSASRER